MILFLWLCINDNLTLRSIFRNPTSTARHQIRDNNQLSKFVAKLEYPIIIIMIRHPACDKTRKSTINWSVFVNNKLEITFYTTAATIYNSAVSESMYMKLVLHEKRYVLEMHYLKSFKYLHNFFCQNYSWFTI